MQKIVAVRILLRNTYQSIEKKPFRGIVRVFNETVHWISSMRMFHVYARIRTFLLFRSPSIAKGGEETRADQPFTRPYRRPLERGLTSALSSQRRSARPFHATTPSRPHCQPTSTGTLLSFAFPLVSRCPSHDFPSVEAFSSFLICPFSSGAPPSLLTRPTVHPPASSELQQFAANRSCCDAFYTL